ncbi:MAG: hypothetical protein AB1403_00230 [Candidatus Riflebacteria bacterium]
MIDINLVELNGRIVERLKYLDSTRFQSGRMEFGVGDMVSFTTPQNEQFTGIISKFNRKTVTVITQNKQKWNVSPVYLRKAEQK